MEPLHLNSLAELDRISVGKESMGGPAVRVESRTESVAENALCCNQHLCKLRHSLVPLDDATAPEVSRPRPVAVIYTRTLGEWDDKRRVAHCGVLHDG